MKLMCILSVVFLIISSLGTQNSGFATEYGFNDNNIICNHITSQIACTDVLYPSFKGGSGGGRSGSSRSSKSSESGFFDDFVNDLIYLLVFFIILALGSFLVDYNSKRKKRLEEKKSQYRVEMLLKLIIKKNIKKTTYKELAGLMNELEGFNDYSYQRARWDLKRLNIIQKIENTQPKTIYIDLKRAKESAIEKS